MGKNLKALIIVSSILIAGSVITNVIAGSTGEPGSIDDPLVTKSYVDEQVQLKVKEQVSLIQQQGLGDSVQIIVEKLDAGDVLIADTGTELILRGGVAVTYGDGSNGIPDLTGGTDLKIGVNVPKNHLLMIPRDDGRGIKITKGPAYVMIRGGFEVK